jgi:hypothetical protein
MIFFHVDSQLYGNMTQTHSPTIDNDRLREKAEDSLTQALEADTPAAKNYHIRQALQYCTIQRDR